MSEERKLRRLRGQSEKPAAGAWRRSLTEKADAHRAAEEASHRERKCPPHVDMQSPGRRETAILVDDPQQFAEMETKIRDPFASRFPAVDFPDHRIQEHVRNDQTSCCETECQKTND